MYLLILSFSLLLMVLHPTISANLSPTVKQTVKEWLEPADLRRREMPSFKTLQHPFETYYYKPLVGVDQGSGIEWPTST